MLPFVVVVVVVAWLWTRIYELEAESKTIRNSPSYYHVRLAWHVARRRTSNDVKMTTHYDIFSFIVSLFACFILTQFWSIWTNEKERAERCQENSITGSRGRANESIGSLERSWRRSLAFLFFVVYVVASVSLCLAIDELRPRFSLVSTKKDGQRRNKTSKQDDMLQLT